MSKHFPPTFPEYLEKIKKIKKDKELEEARAYHAKNYKDNKIHTRTYIDEWTTTKDQFLLDLHETMELYCVYRVSGWTEWYPKKGSFNQSPHQEYGDYQYREDAMYDIWTGDTGYCESYWMPDAMADATYKKGKLTLNEKKLKDMQKYTNEIYRDTTDRPDNFEKLVFEGTEYSLETNENTVYEKNENGKTISYYNGGSLPLGWWDPETEKMNWYC